MKQSLLQRPLLLASLIFGFVLVLLLVWIALGEGGLNSDVYRP